MLLKHCSLRSASGLCLNNNKTPCSLLLVKHCSLRSASGLCLNNLLRIDYPQPQASSTRRDKSPDLSAARIASPTIGGIHPRCAGGLRLNTEQSGIPYPPSITAAPLGRHRTYNKHIKHPLSNIRRLISSRRDSPILSAGTFARFFPKAPPAVLLEQRDTNFYFADKSQVCLSAFRLIPPLACNRLPIKIIANELFAPWRTAYI